MRKAFSLFVFSLFISNSFAQNVSVINGEGLSAKEFMWSYKKSHNGNTSVNQAELLNYLKQYINFKLKVLDAKDMGLDKNPLYKEEIKTYETALKAHNKITKGKKDVEYLLNEYRDGVLMFNVSEQKIWNKAQNDEQALNNFYAERKTDYIKPLNDIRGEVIADYQQSLEDKWIKELKLKYNIKINENELNKLAKP